MRIAPRAALAGCGPPCGPWGDIAISDESDSPDVAELVRTGLSDMERWTGRDEVCVAEVRLERDLVVRGERIAGFYRRGRREIVLAAPWPVDHEVCHALDEGLSDDPAFPEVEGASEDLYPTAAARKREQFANLCGLGPPVPGFTLPYAAACDGLSEAQRILLDEVWQGDVPEVNGGPGAWSYAVEEGVAVDLAPDEVLWGAVAAPGGLLAITLVEDADQEGDPATSLVRIDLPGGATTRLIPAQRGAGWFVFPTDGPVVLLPVEEGDATVLGSGRRLAVGGYVGPGIVAGGRLWYGTSEGLSSVDLTTGEAVPTGYPYGEPVYRAVHDGKDLVFALFDGTLARLDLQTGAWSRDPGPRFPFGELVAYGDDTLVTYVSDDESPLVRVAPDGTWSIPACDRDAEPITSLWAVDGALWTVRSAGEGAVSFAPVTLAE